MGSRLTKIGVENTDENRRMWRQILFTSPPEACKAISGAILFHDTLYQKDDQVLISPTFFNQLSQTEVFREDFLYLKFVFVIFGQKKVGPKAACKMLVKLTTGQTICRASQGEEHHSR
jgi:hypothetical protein